MSERKDLTRWNRAGLSRFRYVDGKAAEYLEILRQQLVDKFEDSKTKRCEWLNPAEKTPANELKRQTETLLQRQERLSRTKKRILKVYQQDRRDWAWEITRTFARACHILTEYVDAYANEGYLGTATQWDNVRRLVEMLDYHPAPPASASTRLVFIAKENKKGIVTKGFQVKNNPAPPEVKVIFETLADIEIDAALNELRPKGWSQSDDPALPPSNGNNGSTQTPTAERKFSPVANGPVINLQGVGQTWANQLNTLPDTEDFKIKDFLDLDPEEPGVVLDTENLGEDPGDDAVVVRLRELKAKATEICNFELESGWSDISDWFLPDIALESPDSLAKNTGKSLDKVKALQQKIELIGAFLDHGVYKNTKLEDMVAPVGAVTEETVVTSWRAKRKPKIATNEVAMIYREYKDENTGQYIDEAEAATIANIDKKTRFIHLKPDLQTTWYDWKKSEALLKVSPRWKRECWLNGGDVIRTEEPHGLSEGSYITWKVNDSWRYAKVTEADKLDLRLEMTGPLPQKGTALYELLPIEGDTMPADFEAIVLLKDSGDDITPAIEDISPALKDPPYPENIPNPAFWVKKGDVAYESGGGLLPPATIPGLSEIGSFLFPSPMLPMDLVKAAVKMLLNLGVMQIPSTEKFVFKGLPLSGLPAGEGETDVDKAANALFTLLNELQTKDEEKLIKWDDSLTNDTEKQNALKAILESILERSGDEPTTLFKKIEENMEDDGIGPLLAIPKSPPVKAVVEAGEPLYMFDGSPEKLETGDWVIGEFADGLRAVKISSVNEFSDERFSLSFENLDGNIELKRVYADFRGELIAEGATVNSTDVDPDNLELEVVPDSLKAGSEVLLTAKDKEPVAAKIESIDGNTIKTNPPPVGFTKGELIIRGNVVLAGHGESKPEKILGSGNAARSNQEFTIEVEGISFTPDATKTAGVAAAIEVKVDGRLWQQVSTLRDSGPGDHHYAIRMTEEGYVKILFGDGEYGRRLPSGKNNIRISYRVGSGLAGHVPAGGLEKPVSPHPLIKAVLQPMQAAGGGDMEDMVSLRENAPATLLTLERAVSLSDFSHLAAAQSSVWQAKAYSRLFHVGRTENIKVVIVPADGVHSKDIKNDIENFLQKHAMPGVRVTVDNFEPVLFDLSVTVRVKIDEFIADDVEKAVISTLKDHFALKNRKLGENLYLSEVYNVVENVRGVENSICVLNNDETLQLIRAANDSTVIYLDINADQNPSTLTVTHREYQP